MIHRPQEVCGRIHGEGNRTGAHGPSAHRRRTEHPHTTVLPGSELATQGAMALPMGTSVRDEPVTAAARTGRAIPPGFPS